MIGYRIQSADRDPAELLDPGNWWSENWGGGGDPREGVSVCASVNSLVGYFEARAMNGAGYDREWLAGEVIVSVEGDESHEADEDAAEGAYLVFPTRVVDVRPLTDDEIDEILSRA